MLNLLVLVLVNFVQDTRYYSYESLASVSYEPLICDYEYPLDSVKIFSTWDMIDDFWHTSPQNYLAHFVQDVSFANLSKFFVKARHQTWSAIRFWKFSNSRI